MYLLNKGENHTKVISSQPKCKEMMEILAPEQVLLSEKLKRRNCQSKNIKRKKSPKKQATENRARRPFNSELGSKNAPGWSSPKGLKKLFSKCPNKLSTNYARLQIYYIIDYRFFKNEHNKKLES